MLCSKAEEERRDGEDDEDVPVLWKMKTNPWEVVVRAVEI